MNLCCGAPLATYPNTPVVKSAPMASTKETGSAVRLLTGELSRALFRRLMRNRTPVFMLHRRSDPAHHIDGHSVDFLRASLAALRQSGAKFISLRTLVDAWRSEAPVDPNWVVFTI